MNKVFKSIILLALAGTAQADLSANLGYMSEYHFRGILQKVSSTSGGLDYESGGFYVGTWAADVGDGLEVDGYFGYGADVGDVSLSIGYTGYFYTGDFDDTYLEANFSLGWRWFTLDYARGEWDGFGDKQDYDFYSLTAEYNGFYGKVGTFGKDFDGTYYEGGYGSDLTVNDYHIFDYSIYVVHSDSTLLGGDSDTNLVFSLTKGFDL